MIIRHCELLEFPQGSTARPRMLDARQLTTPAQRWDLHHGQFAPILGYVCEMSSIGSGRPRGKVSK
jgi:hypothetical protein